MLCDGISEVNRRFADAIRAGDASAAAAVYEDDARLLPPGAPEVLGRDAILRFWRDAIDAGVCAVELETLALEEPEPTLTCEVGAFRLRLEPEGAEPQTQLGKYVVLHRRRPDGTWRWAVDIFNTDA